MEKVKSELIAGIKISNRDTTVDMKNYSETSTGVKSCSPPSTEIERNEGGRQSRRNKKRKHKHNQEEEALLEQGVTRKDSLEKDEESKTRRKHRGRRRRNKQRSQNQDEKDYLNCSSEDMSNTDNSENEQYPPSSGKMKKLTREKYRKLKQSQETVEEDRIPSYEEIGCHLETRLINLEERTTSSLYNIEALLRSAVFYRGAEGQRPQSRQNTDLEVGIYGSYNAI